MSLTLIQKWNVIEGSLLLAFMLLLMIYPEIFGLLNFSDREWTATEYDIIRAMGTAVFVIGGYFMYFGLQPYFNEYIIKNILGEHTSNPSLYWTITTVVNRVVLVPLALIILNIFTWNRSSKIIILTGSIFFTFYDLSLGLVTLCITRKYGPNENNIYQNVKDDNDEELEQLSQ